MLVIYHPEIETSILTKSFKKTTELKQIFRLFYNSIFSHSPCEREVTDLNLSIHNFIPVSSKSVNERIICNNGKYSTERNTSVNFSLELESNDPNEEEIAIDSDIISNFDVKKSCFANLTTGNIQQNKIPPKILQIT